MSIYLVRHGETAGNATRTLQFPETPLSERGRAQAARVAARLVSVGAAAIVASDHLRAAETAEAVAAASGLPVAWEPLLAERNFGELRGRRIADLDFDPMGPDVEPAGGENWAGFDARVGQAFAAIVAARARLDRPLIVVSHGLMIRQMLRFHLRLPAGVALPEALGNTSVTICEAASPFEVSVLGSIDHLDERTAHDGRSLSGF